MKGGDLSWCYSFVGVCSQPWLSQSGLLIGVSMAAPSRDRETTSSELWVPADESSANTFKALPLPDGCSVPLPGQTCFLAGVGGGRICLGFSHLELLLASLCKLIFALRWEDGLQSQAVDADVQEDVQRSHAAACSREWPRHVRVMTLCPHPQLPGLASNLFAQRSKLRNEHFAKL